MSNRLLAVTFAALSKLPLLADESIRPAVTVHEWGTFTTVASENGTSVLWRSPASADLPCFVERFTPFLPKVRFPTLVRMETPVLYFYSPRPARMSVRVDFPQGLITEWYPKASALFPAPHTSQPRGGRIDWNSIEILGATLHPPILPTANGPSHYFAARATDAAAIRVNGQTEKMLFYRGVANFEVPLQAKFENDGRLRVRNTGTATIPVAIYFENREGKSGKVGFRIIRDLSTAASIEWQSPELSANVKEVHEALALELVRAGLYPKEAAAMIETWRDSWFEPGTRVFYLTPRSLVDAVLPLQMNPQPAAVERVFVGRVELLSPWSKSELLAATSAVPLVKMGRFLDPFMEQLKRTNGDARPMAAYSAAAQQLYTEAAAQAGCIR